MINNDLRIHVNVWLDGYCPIGQPMDPQEAMALIEFLRMSNIHHESIKYRLSQYHIRIEQGQIQLNISLKPIDSYKED